MDSRLLDEVPGVYTQNNVCVLYIDHQCYLGGATTFADVEYTNGYATDNLLMEPLVIAQILRTFQIITDQSYLGSDIDSKKMKLLIEGATPQEAELQYTSFTESALEGEDAVMRPRVMQYVQTLQGDDGEILGWLLFYVAQDNAYSFDKAFANYCYLEKEKEKRRKYKPNALAAAAAAYNAKQADAVILPFRDPEEFIKRGVLSYLTKAPSAEAVNRALNSKFHDVNNPFKFNLVFSLERALAWHYLMRRRDLTLNHYLSSVGVFASLSDISASSQEFKIIFPTPAYEVPTLKKNHRVFFGIDFDEFLNGKEIKQDETPEEAILRCRQEQITLGKTAKVQSAREALKALVAKKKAQGVNMYEWCQSAEADRLIQAVLASDEMCPSTRAAFKWYRENMSGKPLVRPVDFIVDDKLTFHGNMLARDALKLEMYAGILFLHHEMIFLLVTMMMACSLLAVSEVFMHVMFNGPRASGKSFVMNLLSIIMIPGTTVEVNMQSEKALTAEDDNLNGMVILHDELTDNFVNKKNPAAMARQKTALSKGVLKSEHLHIAENGQRIKIKTESHVRGINILNSNLGESHFEEALLDRMAVFGMPNHHDDQRDEVVQTLASRIVDIDNEAKNQYSEEWRIRQLCAAVLHTWISVGAIDPIDDYVPSCLIPQVRRVLKDAGYVTDARPNFRVDIQSQANCMRTAVDKTFFTTDHFHPSTPFRFGHVIQCTRYLTCEREHFWSALGQLFPSMIKPFVDSVLEAFYELVMEQRFELRFPKSKWTGGLYEPDYDYYVLDVSNSTMAVNDGIAKLVCTTIRSRMKSGRETPSEDNVYDVIKWLETSGSYESHYTFDGLDRWTKRKEPINIAKCFVQGYGSPRGWAVSRELLEKITDSNGVILPDSSSRGLLYRCIEATMTQEQKESGVKYVTGATLRHKDKPYLCEVYSQDEMDKMRKYSDSCRQAKEALFSSPPDPAIVEARRPRGDAPTFIGSHDDDHDHHRVPIVKKHRTNIHVVPVQNDENSRPSTSFSPQLSRMASTTTTTTTTSEAPGAGNASMANPKKTKMSAAVRRKEALRAGEDAWTLEIEKMWFATYYGEPEKGESLEKFYKRMWDNREDFEKEDFGRYVQETLDEYEMPYDEIFQLFGSKVLLGSKHKRDYAIQVGKKELLKSLRFKWDEKQKNIIQANQIRLGAIVLRQARQQAKLDASVEIDRHMEDFFRNMSRFDWLFDPNLLSERQALAERIRAFNPDNLDLDELARDRWMKKTGWADHVPMSHWAPPKILYMNYPFSEKPRDYYKRTGLLDAFKEELLQNSGPKSVGSGSDKESIMSSSSHRKKQRRAIMEEEELFANEAERQFEEENRLNDEEMGVYGEEHGLVFV